MNSVAIGSLPKCPELPEKIKKAAIDNWGYITKTLRIPKPYIVFPDLSYTTQFISELENPELSKGLGEDITTVRTEGCEFLCSDGGNYSASVEWVLTFCKWKLVREQNDSTGMPSTTLWYDVPTKDDETQGLKLLEGLKTMLYTRSYGSIYIIRSIPLFRFYFIMYRIIE
jgi:hypothetical protein